MQYDWDEYLFYHYDYMLTYFKSCVTIEYFETTEDAQLLWGFEEKNKIDKYFSKYVMGYGFRTNFWRGEGNKCAQCGIYYPEYLYPHIKHFYASYCYKCDPPAIIIILDKVLYRDLSNIIYRYL